jgi:sulfate transport system ATP-binding protein
MSIEARHLSKMFGRHAALRDVSLTVKSGELVALLGPSGSGKTTLLRILAGLEAPDVGTVHFDGADATDRRTADRRVGFVFQHYALFRHMTVFENVAFGLRVRPREQRPSNHDVERRVNELLSLVQLDYLGDRYPSQLSGGQRQRVALARALAVEPKVLLLDEPFGALDAKVRQELRAWLRRLHRQIHVTSVFVTHDQEEALELADRVVIMNEGRVEQDGTPDAIVEHPATPFVMTFVGEANVFQGRVQSGRAIVGPWSVEYPDHGSGEARAAVAYVRPHQMRVSRDERIDGLEATIHDVRTSGAVVRLAVRTARDEAVQIDVSREEYERLRLEVGAKVRVTPTRLRVFAAS